MEQQQIKDAFQRVTSWLLSGKVLKPARSGAGVANWMHTFSPTFFGETLVTFSRDFTAIEPTIKTESNAEVPFI